ncbi:MAG: hypothetical protein ACKVE4_10885 [Dissulfuribacterales bacterium]
MKDPLQYLKISYLIFFLALPSYASAFTLYQPETPVEIMTEATAGDMPGSNPVISRITIRTVSKNSDVAHIGFFKPKFKPEPEQPIGTLKFFSSGTVMWDAAGDTIKQFHAANLFIIPGLTIPVDVLPVNRFLADAEPAVFEFHRQAGGRTFVDRIRISAYSVSREKAQQAQWLRIDGDVPLKLRMIEASDLQTGKLIVRQLWAPGRAWWLYEQTLFRRSWRVR